MVMSILYNADLDFIDILSKSIENGDYSDGEELFPGLSDEREMILLDLKNVFVPTPKAVFS